VVLVAALAAHGCGGDDAGAEVQPRPAGYADGVDGLTRLIGDLLAAASQHQRDRGAAIAASLELPEPPRWFAAHFAPALAGRLARDYAALHGHFVEIADQIALLSTQGRILVTVERFDDPDAGDATGYQSLALRAMTDRVSLYSVRMRKDGEGEGFHMWSFIHDGTGFRWIGKLKAVNGEARPGDPDLLELRVRSVKRP